MHIENTIAAMETKNINVIITGATGMVGEGVLHECLKDPKIASITLISRRSTGVVHPKIKEVLLTDLFAFTGEIGRASCRERV